MLVIFWGNYIKKNNDIHMAIIKLKEVLETNPYQDVYQKLGNTYFMNGELDKAEDMFFLVI